MRSFIAFSLLLSACSPRLASPKSEAVSSASTGSWVLDFAGGSQYESAPHVNHGYFWPHDGSALGPFFVQAWVMPRDSGSRYWLSAGYGGPHEFLGGFVQAGAGAPNYLYGGWLSRDAVCYATGSTGITPGTWVHVAGSWDGTYFRWYVNGVLDAKLQCQNARVAVSLADGGGELFVGGSNHNNFDGRIAEVEFWEGYQPLALPDSPFLYERRFTAAAWDGATATPASFLAYYTVPSDIIADMSPVGYLGRLHPGVPYAAAGSEDRGFGYAQPYTGIMPPASQGPLPTWAFDTSAPTAQ